MGFTVSDFDDLKRLLGEHPEWCVELRHLLLSNDMEALPALVRDLIHAQQRTEQRLAELAEAQRQSEQRLAELATVERRTDDRLAELAEAQGRTEERLNELAAAQHRTEQRLAELAEAQGQTEVRLARLEEAQINLTAQICQLAARMDQLTERMDQLTARVDQLAARMDQLTERMDQLTARVDQLAARMDQLTERVDQLTARVDQLAARMDELAEKMGRLTDKMGWMDGVLLELLYGKKVPGYFGRWLRRARAVDLDELWDALESALGHEETHDALMTDLVVRGRVATLADRPEAYLIVEVSAVIDQHDVERAVWRAELFRRAGFPAIPAVAGREATGSARWLAEARGVAMLEDGKESYWDRAIDRWPVS